MRQVAKCECARWPNSLRPNILEKIDNLAYLNSLYKDKTDINYLEVLNKIELFTYFSTVVIFNYFRYLF